MSIAEDLKKMFTLKPEEPKAEVKIEETPKGEGQEAAAGAEAFSAGDNAGEAQIAEGAQDAAKAEEGQGGGDGAGEAAEGKPSEREAALEAQVKELKDLVLTLAKKQEESEEPVDENVIPPIELKDEEFVSEEDFEALTTDRTKFNAVINNARKRGSLDAVEHMSKVLPALVTKIATQQANTMFYVNEFWKNNKDLRDIEGIQDKASETYTELARLNPTKSMEEIFGLLGNALRKEYKPAQPVQKPKPPTNPGTGGQGQRQQTEKKTTTVRDEINAMKKVV